MSNDIRKNAATMPVEEFEAFMRACVLLKHEKVPGKDFSVYDQWVAVHGCIMGIRAPGESRFRNVGHQGIGFLPWHREYLRRFELALQSVVPGVTIPYWPWPMRPEPSSLFSNARIHRIFFSRSSQRDVGGLFAASGPSNPPSWWPSGFAWEVHEDLRVASAPVLRRGSSEDGWPPTAAAVRAVENLNRSSPGVNPYWAFWRRLEGGRRMHNSGHNIVGGYMANPVFSPNDPIFWIHHSFVDRVWWRWQTKRLAEGGTRLSHYPPQSEVSPINGRLPHPGHRRDDLMWPWVGTTSGFAVNAPNAVQRMLPDFSSEPGRRIRDVLNIGDLGADLGGYAYA
ncbi:MAG: tyrosinase family protein [Myxococcota bacterium]